MRLTLWLFVLVTLTLGSDPATNDYLSDNSPSEISSMGTPKTATEPNHDFDFELSSETDDTRQYNSHAAVSQEKEVHQKLPKLHDHPDWEYFEDSVAPAIPAPPPVILNDVQMLKLFEAMEILGYDFDPMLDIIESYSLQQVAGMRYDFCVNMKGDRIGVALYEDQFGEIHAFETDFCGAPSQRLRSRSLSMLELGVTSHLRHRSGPHPSPLLLESNPRLVPLPSAPESFNSLLDLEHDCSHHNKYGVLNQYSSGHCAVTSTVASLSYGICLKRSVTSALSYGDVMGCGKERDGKISLQGSRRVVNPGGNSIPLLVMGFAMDTGIASETSHPSWKDSHFRGECLATNTAISPVNLVCKTLDGDRVFTSPVLEVGSTIAVPALYCECPSEQRFNYAVLDTPLAAPQDERCTVVFENRKLFTYSFPTSFCEENLRLAPGNHNLAVSFDLEPVKALSKCDASNLSSKPLSLKCGTVSSRIISPGATRVVPDEFCDCALDDQIRYRVSIPQQGALTAQFRSQSCKVTLSSPGTVLDMPRPLCEEFSSIPQAHASIHVPDSVIAHVYQSDMHRCTAFFGRGRPPTRPKYSHLKLILPMSECASLGISQPKQPLNTEVTFSTITDSRMNTCDMTNSGNVPIIARCGDITSPLIRARDTLEVSTDFCTCSEEQRIDYTVGPPGSGILTVAWRTQQCLLSVDSKNLRPLPGHVCTILHEELRSTSSLSDSLRIRVVLLPNTNQETLPQCKRQSVVSPLHVFPPPTTMYNPGVADIQQRVLLHGPVVAGITLYNDFGLHFQTPDFGVYKHRTGAHYKSPTAEEIVEAEALDSTSAYKTENHAMVLYGWDLSGPEPHWLFQNSWGPFWGEKGSLRVSINVPVIVMAATYWECSEKFKEYPITVVEKEASTIADSYCIVDFKEIYEGQRIASITLSYWSTRDLPRQERSFITISRSDTSPPRVRNAAGCCIEDVVLNTL